MTNNKIILILIFLVATCFVLYLFFQNSNNQKNSAESNLISRGVGWKNNVSNYSGSEANALVKNTDKISFGFETVSKANQSVQITIDKDIYTISSPNINNQLLTIKLDKNKMHMVNFKHICSYEKFPCSMKLSSLHLHGGELLTYNPTKKIISVLGDSISTIYGGDNFTFLLAHDIGYELHNSSILGSTISSVKGYDNLINRYKKDLKGFNSNIVLLFSGTNDIAQNISIEKFSDSYLRIIKNIKKENRKSKIYVVSILPRQDINQQIIDSYNEAIQKLATNENINYVNVSSDLEPGDFLDAIHPLVESQRKIADSIHNSLFPK